MILAPEDIERFLTARLMPGDSIDDMADNTVVSVADLRETLRAYAEVAQKVAEREPVTGVGMDGDTYICVYCADSITHGEGWWFPEDVEHKPDCSWVKARQLRGLS